MIKKLKRFAKQQELVIENLARSADLVELACPASNVTGSRLRDTIASLYATRFIREDVSPNPNFLTSNQIDLSFLATGQNQIRACEMALIHTFLESDLDTPLENLWITFLGVYSASLGHTVVILPAPDGQHPQKRFFLQLHAEKLDDFLGELHKIIQRLRLPLEFSAKKANAHEIGKKLKHIHKKAVDFYINKDPDWLQDFSDQLGDDLSRAALFSFLRQRMQGKVFYDTDIMYAMTPSPQSADYRRKALSERDAWPWLVSSTVTNLPFMVVNTFLLEQYRIPGVVEAKPGDNILDLGAAFGDSTVYFAQLTGNTGRILAIDPLPDNVEDLKKNLALYNCRTAEICSYGLGDRDMTAWVHSDKTDSNSVAEISAKEQENSTPVRITTMDAIATDMRVDFVKADIEGAELAMLHGGKETIKRDKPTFALALYHKENDFRELPQTLSEYNPDYVYFIRLDAEPMFFAIDKNKLQGKQ